MPVISLERTKYSDCYWLFLGWLTRETKIPFSCPMLQTKGLFANLEGRYECSLQCASSQGNNSWRLDVWLYTHCLFITFSHSLLLSLSRSSSLTCLPFHLLSLSLFSFSLHFGIFVIPCQVSLRSRPALCAIKYFACFFLAMNSNMCNSPTQRKPKQTVCWSSPFFQGNSLTTASLKTYALAPFVTESGPWLLAFVQFVFNFREVSSSFHSFLKATSGSSFWQLLQFLSWLCG